METVTNNSFIYTNENAGTSNIKRTILLSIYSRPEYFAKGLAYRIKGRLSYKRNSEWNPCIERIEVKYRGERRHFHANVSIGTDCADLDKFKEQVAMRLGATSGKPWVCCKVVSVR